MGNLKARQVLFQLATFSQRKRERFSRREILKKINQVKSLAAQKNVPRLTLRKELVHLENHLQGVFELETRLHKQEKEDGYKLGAMKRQVTTLRKKLDSCEDKDLQQKVAKLSHLLGEVLAKKGTEQDIELQERIAQELEVKKNKIIAIKKNIVAKKDTLSEETERRVAHLQNRLDALKSQLELTQELEKSDPQQLQLIEQKINLLEEKLGIYYQKFPHLMGAEVKKEEEVSKPIEVKHTLMFEEPSGISSQQLIFGTQPQEVHTEEEIEELPLPPPPRVMR